MVAFDFGDGVTPREVFVRYEAVLEDRGSRYAVSVGRAQNREDINRFLVIVKSDKKFAKATHNSWAARLRHEGAIYETKQDDGETGAGLVILRELQRVNAVDTVVCVTRWFGGVKLMSDRFRHVQDAARLGLERSCG